MNEAQSTFQQAKIDLAEQRAKEEAEQAAEKAEVLVADGGTRTWMKPAEVAERWRIGLSTLKKWMANGRVSYFEASPREKRISLEWVKRFEEAGCPLDSLTTLLADIKNGVFDASYDPVAVADEIGERLEAILELEGVDTDEI